MSNRIHPAKCFSAALLAILLAGCGGGGAAATHGGSFQIHIKWPSTTRDLPILTQVVKIRVIALDGTTVEQDINRPQGTDPTSTASFTDLPSNAPLDIEVGAYGSASGTGPMTLLGFNAEQVTLKSDSANTVTIDLLSTIDHFGFSGTGVVGDSLTLASGASTTVNVSAFSADSNLVPVAPSQLTYSVAPTGTAVTVTPSSTSSSAVVSIAATGAGNADITVSDSRGAAVGVLHVNGGGL